MELETPYVWTYKEFNNLLKYEVTEFAKRLSDVFNIDLTFIDLDRKDLVNDLEDIIIQNVEIDDEY